MITGDHEKTARAIATQIDLLPEDGMVLEGYQLNQMSIGDLKNIIEDVYVFARVTPEHKIKIVQAFQYLGHIVAMIGDGVIDESAIYYRSTVISICYIGNLHTSLTT